MKFSPCISDKCTYEGTHCEGCGRSHEEIAETKRLVGNLVDFAKKMDYENHEAFASFIGNSLFKKLQKPT
ncbi:hypothetical protein MCAMS1_02786 [biofilm metagenome]